MGSDQNLRESSVKSMNDNVMWFCVKNNHSFARFLMKLLKLRESKMNGTRFHNWELKCNVIPWNAEHFFKVWIFHEHEFTDPSLLVVLAVSNRLFESVSRNLFTVQFHRIYSYWKNSSNLRLVISVINIAFTKFLPKVLE